MKTILDKLLFNYVGIMDIEYLGARCAKITLVGAYRKHKFEWRYFMPTFNNNGYWFDWIEDWDSDGKTTTFTVKLLPKSKPFFEPNN